MKKINPVDVYERYYQKHLKEVNNYRYTLNYLNDLSEEKQSIEAIHNISLLLYNSEKEYNEIPISERFEREIYITEPPFPDEIKIAKVIDYQLFESSDPLTALEHKILIFDFVIKTSHGCLYRYSREL
ncbi:MAG: hypothetical protein WC444_05870 [Candidatus Paceibacterota bacterium]|jgi:hypothetical protein